MGNGRSRNGAAVLEPPTHMSSQGSQTFGRVEPEAPSGAVERLSALDFVSTNVMIADTEYKITYMNEGVRKLLAEAEGEIRKDLPNFNASQLIGRSLDLFHKNPAHQRRILDTLREPYKACIKVGGSTFDLMATPVFDPESRARLGTMVEWSDASQRLLNLDYGSQVAAIRKSQAVIEFNMDGTVLTANDNFLNALGYTLDEIKGRHHSMFVDEAFRQSCGVQGVLGQAQPRRVPGGGIQAHRQGRKGSLDSGLLQSDLRRERQALQSGQVRHRCDRAEAAQRRLHGPDRRHPQVAGGHRIQHGRHRARCQSTTFLTPSATRWKRSRAGITACSWTRPIRQSAEYKEFWAKLNRGEYQAAEYKRIGKGGKEVWIQASYNPILDLNGKPFKVVKYATDVTAQKLALNAMLADAAMLTKAAVEGKLATRADASKHQGDFRKVVEGVNATLDAVIGPLNVSAEYVDRISKGDIPPKITDTYNGDFNEIKNNLNTCIDAVNALVADAGMLTKAAVEGKLATRADASKHQGDYRKIVEGVNETLDAVIGPLNVSAEYVDRISKGDIPPKITDTYNGDFNEIKNNLNNCIDDINALVADAGMLIKAAVEGKLATRADASQAPGRLPQDRRGRQRDAGRDPAAHRRRCQPSMSTADLQGKIDELIADNLQRRLTR